MNIFQKTIMCLLIFSIVCTLSFYSYTSSEQPTNPTLTPTPHEPPANPLLPDTADDIDFTPDAQGEYPDFDIDFFDESESSMNEPANEYASILDNDPTLLALNAKAKEEELKYTQATKQADTTIANTNIAPPETPGNLEAMEIPLADTVLTIPKPLLTLMPTYASTYLNTLSIRDVTIILGAANFGEGMMFSGNVWQNNAVVKMSDGRPLKAVVINVDKTDKNPGGYLALIELPPSWKPSQLTPNPQSTPNLSALDGITFKNSILVVSTFSFTNNKAGYTAQPGVNVVTEIDPTTVTGSPLYNNFATIYKAITTQQIAQLVLSNKPFLRLSFFGKDIKKPSVLLTDYFNITPFNIPPKTADNLTNFALKNPRIDFILGGSGSIGQSIQISAVGTILGKDVQALLAIERKSLPVETPATDATPPATDQPTKTEMVITKKLYIKLPQGWSLADIAPNLQNNLNLTFEEPELILTDRDDEELKIQKGLNFKAHVSLTVNTPPALSDFKSVFDILNIKRLAVSGLISNDSTKSKLKLVLPLAPGKTIKLTDIVGTALMNTLPLPPAINTEIQNIAIQKPEIEINVSAQAQKALLKGVALFENKQMPISIMFQRDSKGTLGASVTIIPPTGWKIANLSSDLKSVDDAVSFTSTTLVLSTYNYNDPSLKVDIEAGLNIIAKAQLPEALAQLSTVFKNTSQTTATQENEVVFQTVIKPSIKDSKIALILPGTLSLSLKALPGVNQIVSSIQISNLAVAITPASGVFKTGATASITFPPPHQPLTTTASIIIEEGGTGIEIALSSIPKLFNWLEMNNAGFKIVVAGEIPTDFEAYGSMVLNNDPIEFAVKFGKDGNAVTGSAADLSLASMAALFTKITSVSIPNMDKVPALGLKNAAVYIVPIATTIGTTAYEAGYTIKGALDVLGMKGTLDCALNMPGSSQGTVGLTGTATLSKLAYPFFTLDGAGLDKTYGTADDGPVFNLALTPNKQELFVDGRIGVPYLKTYMESTISINSVDGGSASFAQSILGMDGTLSGTINSHGLEASGTLSPLITPVFTIQNAAGNGGPIMSLKATDAKQEAKISGKTTLNIPGLNAGASSTADILLSPQGINFTLGGSILGFDAQYNITGAGDLTKLNVDNLALTITLAQSATDTIKAKFTEAANVLKQEADKGLNAARDKMNAKITELQGQLNQKNKECGF